MSARGRRTCLCLFLLLWGSALWAAQVRVLSFNVNGNASAHRQQNGLWVSEVCAAIAQGGADIVLLQEVAIPLKKRPDTEYFKEPRPDNLLDDLVGRLGGSWRYLSTARYGLRKAMVVDGEEYREGNMTQNNAILYDGSRLAVQDWAERLGFPAFSGEFLFEKNTVQAVEFSLVEGNARFLVLNVHLPYANKAHRERDVRTLERLYARYKLRYPILVGGDFNMHRRELSARNFDFVDGTESWYYDRAFGLKTTVSKRSDDVFRLANDYDHFIYNARLPVTEGMRRSFSRTRSDTYPSVMVGTLPYTSAAAYAASLSDHVPVVITMDWPDDGP